MVDLDLENFNKFQNSQKYHECVLVAAINALNYLTKGNKIIHQNSKEYEKWVDYLQVKNKGIPLTDDRVKKLWVDIGIYPKAYSTNIKDINSFPILTSVIIPNDVKEHHAILITDYKDPNYRITNLKYKTDNGWINQKILNTLFPKKPFFILFDLIQNIKIENYGNRI